MKRLMIDTKRDPRFMPPQNMSVCMRCRRNVEPAYNRGQISEMVSVGKNWIVAGKFCPHCRLQMKARVYRVN